MYAEITECTIYWGTGKEMHIRPAYAQDVNWVDFRDWTNMHPLLNRVDVGHRRRYSRWVIRINLECIAT